MFICTKCKGSFDGLINGLCKECRKPTNIIDLDGKYQFVETEGYKLKCERYNEPWRDFIGDKAVHRLFSHAIELEAKTKMLTEIVKGLLVDCKEYNCKDNCGHYRVKGDCLGVNGTGQCGKITRVEIAEELNNE